MFVRKNYFLPSDKPGIYVDVNVIVSGLNPTIIGGFTGLCALMGVAATFISTKMVERLGMLKVMF